MDNKELVKEIIGIAITTTIAVTVFFICDLFFKLFTWNSYMIIDYAFKLMMLFSVIIFTAFWAISKKSWKATLMSYILIFILSIINQLKITYTLEPLYFSDIHFLKNIGDLFGLITGNVSGESVVFFILMILIYAGILAVLTYISYKFSFEIKSKKIRFSILAVDIILLVCLFVPNKHTKEFYLKTFFNTDEYVDYDSYTTNLGYYGLNGFINGMYGTYLNNIFVEPEGYNENDLNNLLNSANVETKKNGKPNIIVIFSESFWDIDLLDEVEFNKPITSNFRKLAEKEKRLDIITPTYGGMSENVTFEVVTGGSMNYFSKGYIPIMSLYSSEKSKEFPSLVKTLKNNDYKTEITFGKDYYFSEEAYKKIGFDNYLELEENEDFCSSDVYCTDILIDRLKNKDSKPLLYVLATLEGHMPYSKEKYDSYDVEITKSDLSETMNDTIKSYAQGIYNSDKELGRLYEFIENFEEPSIVIFLGDHLPFLYTEDAKNVIFDLEYFNTENNLLNNSRLYNPQALILSNYENDISIPEYLGTDQLLNCIINQLEIDVDPYYKWLYNTSDILPGINKNISFDKQGNLYNPNNLPEEMNEVYKNKMLMQYKFFTNN